MKTEFEKQGSFCGGRIRCPETLLTEMTLTVLLALLSWLFIPLSSAGSPCPNKTAILPCTCTHRQASSETHALSDTPSTTPPVPMRKRRSVGEEKHTPKYPDDSPVTTVECKSSLPPSELEGKVSLAVDRRWIDKLVIHDIQPERGHTLARLPSDMLRNGRVRQLEIQNSQLTEDFIRNGSPLKSQTESLHWFKVSNCYLFGALTHNTAGTIQTLELNTLNRLQGVDFSSNHLSAISATAFKYVVRNLTTVILANNNVQLIEASSFSQIALLKHIDLSHNLLTVVSRSYFASPARFLEHIDLSYNSITALPIDFFVNMPALKWVDISNNFLYSLPPQPWSSAWKQLKYVNVSGNFVECDCNLMWLLPLLPPANKTAASKDLPSHTVRGECAQTLASKDDLTEPMRTVIHELTSLKRDSLVC